MTKRQKQGILIGAVVLLIIAILGGFWYYKRTPTYTFSQIKTAVEKHDWDTFSKHVDTKSVIGSLYDGAIDASAAKDENMDNATKAMVQGFAKMLKPAIVEALNGEVETWIKTGKSSFDSNNDETNDKSIQGLTQGASSNKGRSNKEESANAAANNLKDMTDFENIEFKGVTSTRDEGGFKVITLGLHDNKLEADYELDLNMRQLDDGTWQVVSVANFKDYLEAVEKAEAAKLAELNKPIQDEINKEVQIGEIQPNIYSGRAMSQLKFSVPITVASEKMIRYADGMVVVTAPDNTITKIPVTLSLNLDKGNKTLVVQKWLDHSVSRERTLAFADSNKLLAKIELTKITYTDGKTLELLTKVK